MPKKLPPAIYLLIRSYADWQHPDGYKTWAVAYPAEAYDPKARQDGVTSIFYDPSDAEPVSYGYRYLDFLKEWGVSTEHMDVRDQTAEEREVVRKAAKAFPEVKVIIVHPEYQQYAGMQAKQYATRAYNADMQRDTVAPPSQQSQQSQQSPRLCPVRW